MSIFNSSTTTCGSCGHEEKLPWAASVNAGRRPDLRAAVLDGTFQAHVCTSCGQQLRLPPHLTYVDVGRGDWILVESVDRRAQWKEHDAKARALFDAAFGPGASPSARELGQGVQPRIVFGWPSLREKVRAHELGLDDVTLELVKLSILRNVPGGPIGATSLRLAHGDAATLRFEVTDDATEAVSSEVEVPRALYDDIAGDPGPWAPLRTQLSDGLLVDLARLTLDG